VDVFAEFCREILDEIALCPIQMLLPMPPGSGPCWSPWAQPAATSWWARRPEGRREEYMRTICGVVRRSVERQEDDHDPAIL